MANFNADQALDIIKHHLSAGNIAAVAPLAEQLLTAFPSDIRFQNILAEVEGRQGKLNDAIGRYLRVISLDHVNFTAHLKLFSLMSMLDEEGCASVYRAWENVAGDRQEAEDRLIATYGAHDRAYDLFLGMSLVAVRQKRIDRAIELFGHCLTEAGNRAPASEPVETKYAMMAEKYDDIPFHQETVDRFLTFTEQHSPAQVGTAIDAACGTGLAAVRLCQRADRIIGLDMSLEMLNHAEARGLYSQLLCGDMVESMATQLVETADIIICIGATCYLEDIGAFLASAAAALRPGGQLFFSDFPAPPGSGQLVSRHATFRYCRSLCFVENKARAQGLHLEEALTTTAFSLPSYFYKFSKLRQSSC